MIHRMAVVKKNRGNEKGFTLLEVIIAISILTIGLLAVASMQVFAIKGNTLSFGVTEATTWAGDQMEKLMMMPYDPDPYADDDPLDDRDNNGKLGLDDDTPGTADHNVTRRKYTVYWNIAVDADIDDTKTINVIVTWMDHGIQKRVSMRNILPRT